MAYTFDRTPQQADLVLGSESSILEVEALRAELAEWLGQSTPDARLVLDGQVVVSIDTPMMQLLCSLHKTCQASGVGVVHSALSPAFRKYADRLGLELSLSPSPLSDGGVARPEPVPGAVEVSS